MQLIGRMLSFSRLLSNAVILLGAIIGGLVAQWHDPRLVFLLAAVTKGEEMFIVQFSALRALP